MKINFVYMTAADTTEAKSIGKALLDSKLAACVNILDNMRSMYVWKGEVQNDPEVVVIAKTTEEKVPRLIERVKEVHSYECPCIVAIPISGGYPPFLDWIAEEVEG